MFTVKNLLFFSLRLQNNECFQLEKGGFCDADSQLERWRPLLDAAGPCRWSSVACRVASFPGVGLGAQTLPLPHHRLHHRVWGVQLPGHVVLPDQPVHDALVGGRAEVKLGAAREQAGQAGVGDLLEVLLHQGGVGLQLVVEARLPHGFLQVVVEEERVEDDLRRRAAREDTAASLQSWAAADSPELSPW